VSDLRAAVEALAAKWADQPTDYDEDTEQQIEDGRELRAVLAANPADAEHARELMAAGLISAAAAQTALAAKSKHNGKAEHLGFAEWLEDFAESLLNLGK